MSLAHSDFKKAVESLPGLISASIPKQPMNYFTSKIKEKSRGFPNALRNTLKNVMEFNIDGPSAAVYPPLFHRNYTDILNREVEQPAVSANQDDNDGDEGDSCNPDLEEEISPPVEDKFKHISAQPFEDVVAIPQYLKRKKRTRLKKHTSSGDTVTSSSDMTSLNSTCSSTNLDGETARRLSLQSGVCSQVSRSDPNFSRPEKMQNTNEGDISNGSMSQSWSGRMMEQSVSAADLEAKEEILARRLKWRELLPPSAQDFLVDDKHLESLSSVSSSSSSLSKNQTLVLSDKFNQDLFQNELEVQRYQQEDQNLVSEPNDEPTVLYDSNSEAQRASLRLTALMQLEANGSLPPGNVSFTPEEDLTGLNVFDHSLDIYNMYPPSLSLESALAYGPTSGTISSLMPETLSVRNKAHTELLDSGSQEDESMTDFELISISDVYGHSVQSRNMVIAKDSRVMCVTRYKPRHNRCIVL